MRIALITPSFPPKSCGVGDHSSHLGRALRALGCEVSVWTGQGGALADDSIGPVRVIKGPWSVRELAQLSRELEQKRPDLILVQYTPYLFDEKGGPLNLALGPWLEHLKRSTRSKVVVFAHELHYPVEPSLAGIGKGVPQLAAFMGIAAVSDQMIFSCEAMFNQARRLVPWRKSRFGWVPVGANVLPANATASSNDIVRDDQLMLLHFGGSHKSHLLDWDLSALRAAREAFGDDKVVLVLAGVTQAKLEALQPQATSQREALRALGYVSSQEVSGLLKRADLVLAPFSDGVSTRRGSVMAALAHGAPVASTQGIHTDRSFEWNEICALVSVGDERAYQQKVVALLSSELERKRVAKQGLKAYERHFSWQVLAQLLLSKVS